MKPILKLIIAIMLILCLADMPYGFYELVRFAAAGTFVYLSYDYFKNKRGHYKIFCVNGNTGFRNESR
ncbi:DUF6804 family protein, partial [Phocaeicola vulgatus]|uniref:DUF6804 family protein n=1 Tax=Phocaeicola vulgatus TaxID=821 RepID=UPI0032C12001